MKKKIFIIFLLILILLGNMVYADDLIEEETGQDIEIVSVDSTNEPEIQSKHVLVMERSTGTILYEKDAYSKTAMASTTKILTAIVILENCDLQEEVLKEPLIIEVYPILNGIERVFIELSNAVGIFQPSP